MAGAVPVPSPAPFQPGTIEQKISRMASLTLEVKDVPAAAESLKQLATAKRRVSLFDQCAERFK